MARTIDAAVVTALQADEIRLAHFVTMYFSSTLYITDYGHDIDYSGNTYEALNGFMGASDPTETRDLKVNSITLSMSGVDQTFISIFLNQDWVNRRVTLQTAVLDSADAVIGSPITVFDGQITQFQISESDKTSDVSISIASHWADFSRKAGRMTNTNSQQYYFSSDKGFEFSANSVQDIKWGRA